MPSPRFIKPVFIDDTNNTIKTDLEKSPKYPDMGLYRAAAAHSAISESIFMEVDVPWEQAVAETAFFCALAEDPASRISGVIAACRPEHANFAAHLDATSYPRFVGYRRVLHTQPDELSTSPLFRENIALIGKAGLTFDLCILPSQLSTGSALIDAARTPASSSTTAACLTSRFPRQADRAAHRPTHT